MLSTFEALATSMLQKVDILHELVVLCIYSFSCNVVRMQTKGFLHSYYSLIYQKAMDEAGINEEGVKML